MKKETGDAPCDGMTWHCDWLSGEIPLPRDLRINKGCLIYVTAQGEKINTQYLHRQTVGSYESRMQVRADGMSLRFSGNPAKFLNGHNLYSLPGTSCLAVPLATAILTSLGLHPWHWLSDAAERGEWPITTIDLTRGYRPTFAQKGWVAPWLQIAGRVASTARQQVRPCGAYSGHTVYVGQHSRRISLKLYDKAAEMKKRPLPACLPELTAARLAAASTDVLRVEVRLHALELHERKLDRLDRWTLATGDSILDERLAALNLPEDLRMSEEQLSELPRRLRAAYGLWLAGQDLRQHYSRTQFWRYRSALGALGIDITHVRAALEVPARAEALGRPLRDFLQGPGLAMPGVQMEGDDRDVA